LDTKGSSVGAIVIMEDITKGDRILNFTLYGTINDKNDAIFKDQAVGYKRIVDAEGKVFDKIKLVIENYRELPFVKSFAEYKFK
jgi:alpha-L-fucosidase